MDVTSGRLRLTFIMEVDMKKKFQKIDLELFHLYNFMIGERYSDYRCNVRLNLLLKQEVKRRTCTL